MLNFKNKKNKIKITEWKFIPSIGSCLKSDVYYKSYQKWNLDKTPIVSKIENQYYLLFGKKETMLRKKIIKKRFAHT